MSALDQFSSLVATLYEAAADHRVWSRFLDDFYEAAGGTRGCLASIAVKPEHNSVAMQGYSEAELRAYQEYFFQHDLVLDAGMDAIKRRSEFIAPLDELLPYRTLENTEIYNDYYRSLDMHYASCMMLGATGPYSAIGLAAWRPRSRGPFEEEQLRLVQLLEPHVRQAFRLQAELSSLRVKNESLEEALEMTGLAVLALRQDGSVLALSPRAEQMLSRKEAVLLRGAALHAVHSERDAVLQRLIRNAARAADLALSHAPGASGKPGGSMLLPYPGRPHGLQVQILPARSSGTLSASGLAVLALLVDPGSLPPQRAGIVQQLYQLTPIEAKLSDLFLQGVELKEAAVLLKLTYDSTRFHLKQIFRKTNTSRQTDLMRLLLSIPAHRADGL